MASPWASLCCSASFANDLKRWTLFRRGYLQVAVVTGSDRDSAERRFWDQRPSLAEDLVR